MSKDECGSKLTHATGAPVVDNLNIQTAGPRGRNLFRLMSPAQQHVLFQNTARAMGDAAVHIKQRHIANCAKADPAYGAGVAALGLPVPSER